ncbi:carboxypeptidase regulatory-like domain-containing protein, partial [Candidatus Micrarchaeota archaeon]|nr:carboxypeptidase regulatory-like domain-containing protein [Candidatus Micrarchaeota archaeon]
MQVVSALALVPGGYYPRYCPVVVQDSAGSSFRVYTASGGFTGLSGTVSSTGYGAFQMTSAFPYNNYIVRVNGVSKTFQLKSGASCTLCFLNNTPFTDGQVNPSNSNQYCDVSDPWSWQTREAARVVITPGSVSTPLVYGQSISFTAVAYDEDGAVVRYPVEWDVDGDAVELVSYSGDSTGASATFTAEHAGNSYVVARVEGVESRVRLRVLYGALDEIELRLSPVDSYVRSGESVRVIASGFDEDGNAVPVSPSWSLVGDSHVGRLSSSGANASFRGLKVGSVNVSASSGSVSARVRLDVIPGNVSSIVVLRGGEDVDGFFEAEAGSDSALAVQAFDASNNLIDESDLSFVWGALIGSFDDASESEVVFTARESIGSGNLSVRVRGERGESVSENVLVRVYPAALDGIRVSPGGEVSIVSGSLKNFSVVGFDEFGNSIGLRGNPAWSASPSELGRFTGSGMNVTFRGGAAVDGEIAVSYGEFSDSVDVSVSPSGVDSVELFVGNVSANSLLTVQAGGSVGFVAVARDAFGNDVSDDASFSWSVSPSALGSVDADDASASFEAREVLLANNSGSVRVVVFSGGKNKTDSVNVQLVAGPVDEVRVSPESAEVRSGESSNFTVSGSDEFGNLVNVSGARWSVSGLGSYSEFVGSVYSFVASRVGTGRVTATVGSLSDYADVEVSSGRLASIRVSSNNLTVPASFSVGAGSEKNFEVQAFDASGNEIFDGLVFLWRSNVGSFDDAGESENVFAVQERAPASGVVNVSVRDGAISRNASFSVSVSPGVVASVELSPDSVDEIVLGSNESFSVRAFDEFDNLLSGVVFAWSSNGGSFNSSSGSSVLFTASSVGVVNVSVSSGGVFGFVSFEVVRRVSEIEIVLNNEVVDSEVPVIAGESVDFDAVGFDDSGNEVELSGVVWSVESGVGVVDGDGVFSSTVAGASVVSARAEGFSDNASLFVYGSDLSAVEVYRNSELVGASEVVPVGAGSEENFSVRAFDEFGNVLSEDVSISWSSNVGEFDDENAGEVVFTAREEAGVGTISVSVQGDEGNVVQRELNVSIVPSVLDVVEIYSGGELVEDIVLLASGESVVFVARGFDVFENEVQLVRGDWSVEGGRGFVESSSVVNETGQFFVGTYTGGEIGVASVNFTGTAGGYVVGSQVSASDGVEVEVSAGAPANLSLSASYYTYPYSGDDIFVVARLSDEFGNPVSGEEVSFDLVSSPEPAGLLSDLSVVTNESGDALVVLTASSSPAGGLHVVEASVGGLSANYSVNVSSLFVSISGTVYGGGPLEGAAVEVYSFDSSELVDSAVTNSSGSFEFSELLNGSYYLVVGAEGYLDFTSEEILLYPGGSTSIPIQLVSEDSVAPVIEFVSPTLENASGASGIITVNVSVTDDVETNTIVVYANGVEVGGHFSTGQNSSGTTLDLDTVNYMEGDLEVVVFANDSSGNGVFVSRVFFVDNVAPVVEFVSPTPDAGAVVNGSFEVAVNGSDETSLCAWVFVNGSEVGGQCDNSTTGDGNVVFVASEVDSTRYPDGELVVSVLASGLASTIEISRTFVVNNSVPSVPAEIIVSSNASEMLAGESIQFNAVVLDESGNEIEGAVVAWSASGGTIDVVGVFSSNVSGEFVVSAFVGSVVGNASVSVLASAPASVVVSLSNASIVAGESVDFDAV